MNLALGAVFLAILLICPLVCIFFYRWSKYAKAAPKLSILEYLLLSATLSLFLHSSVIILFNLKVDFHFIFRVLAGSLDQTFLKEIETGKYDSYLIQFSLYSFCLFCFSIVLGLLLRSVPTSRKIRMSAFARLIRKNDTPRIAYFNSWWYYFRVNEYKEEYDFLGEGEPLIYVDVLVENYNYTILYTGILTDFITEGEELNRIYLRSTKKKLIFSEKQANNDTIIKSSQREIINPSGLICIPYSKIQNLHIWFFKTEIESKKRSRKVENFEDIISSINTDDLDKFNKNP